MIIYSKVIMIYCSNWNFHNQNFLLIKLPNLFISHDKYVNLFESLLLLYRVVTFVQMTVHLTKLACVSFTGTQ